MARSIIAVIASYVLMFVLTFIIFSGLYMVLRADGSFKPGTFESSNVWMGAAFVASFVIAVIAGFVCAAIARGGKAPLVLAIVVFVLGLVLAIPSLMAKKTNAGLVRGAGDVPMMEAMQKAQEPDWAPFALPFIGAAGVLIGARLKRRS
jgi:archaellum biogenesis protein FlaJ (TadC family)